LQSGRAELTNAHRGDWTGLKFATLSLLKYTYTKTKSYDHRIK